MLTLLAVPLGRAPPRSGRYGRLGFGILVFVFWFVVADDVNDQIQQDLDEFQQQLDEDFGEINSDPSDGVCNEDRFLQDPDC